MVFFSLFYSEPFKCTSTSTTTSPPPHVQANSVGNGGKVLGLKWQRYEAHHPHPLGTESQNVKMVNCTPLQALWLCTGCTARRGSRGIALLFLNHGTRKGLAVSVTSRPLFTAGKDPVPIVQENGWAPGPVWTGAEIVAPPGFDLRTVQPLASHYTDCATRATSLRMSGAIFPTPIHLHEVNRDKFNLV